MDLENKNKNTHYGGNIDLEVIQNDTWILQSYCFMTPKKHDIKIVRPRKDVPVEESPLFQQLGTKEKVEETYYEQQQQTTTAIQHQEFDIEKNNMPINFAY